jgi:hypothetical protein
VTVEETSTNKGSFTRAYYDQKAGRIPRIGGIIIATDDVETANRYNDNVIAEYYSSKKQKTRRSSL